MSLSAVLLAGGESRRMGRDKATLVWRGRPLWEWQVEKLRELRPERIFLSARSDVRWRPVDVELIVDVPPSRGPLSGLAAALTCLGTDHLIALAVDMPFITSEHLRYLCGLATEGIGVIPTMDGKAEPLCAIYPKEARMTMVQALDGNDFSLQAVVKKLVALNILRLPPISGPERELYKSVNEPADLK
jgi:molybdopterin-guanine dinucleotide biosynthesis protein A